MRDTSSVSITDLLIGMSDRVEAPLSRASLLLAVGVELRVPQDSQRPVEAHVQSLS